MPRERRGSESGTASGEKKKITEAWGLLESKSYYSGLDIVYLTKFRPMHLEKKVMA